MEKLDRRGAFRLLSAAAIGGAAACIAGPRVRREPIEPLPSGLGKVLFVDPVAVDIEALLEADLGPDFPFQWIVPVRCYGGRTVRDSFAALDNDDATEILRAIAK